VLPGRADAGGIGTDHAHPVGDQDRMFDDFLPHAALNPSTLLDSGSSWATRSVSTARCGPYLDSRRSVIVPDCQRSERAAVRAFSSRYGVRESHDLADRTDGGYLDALSIAGKLVVLPGERCEIIVTSPVWRQHIRLRNTARQYRRHNRNVRSDASCSSGVAAGVIADPAITGTGTPDPDRAQTIVRLVDPPREPWPDVAVANTRA